jgi:hypothetical protein
VLNWKVIERRKVVLITDLDEAQEAFARYLSSSAEFGILNLSKDIKNVWLVLLMI